MKINFKSHSATQTKKFAQSLIKEILNKKKQTKALIFALTGNLGSGKTTFVQGFLKSLGIKKRITSPTFVLIKNYELRIKNYGEAYHIDCYRISKPKEILGLNFKEIIRNPKNIVLIEWSEKIRTILPKSSIWLKFKHGRKENEREINIVMPHDNT